MSYRVVHECASLLLKGKKAPVVIPHEIIKKKIKGMVCCALAVPFGSSHTQYLAGRIRQGIRCPWLWTGLLVEHCLQRHMQRSKPNCSRPSCSCHCNCSHQLVLSGSGGVTACLNQWRPFSTGMGFYRSLKFHEFLVRAFLAEDPLVSDFRKLPCQLK